MTDVIEQFSGNIPKQVDGLVQEQRMIWLMTAGFVIFFISGLLMISNMIALDQNNAPEWVLFFLVLGCGALGTWKLMLLVRQIDDQYQALVDEVMIMLELGFLTPEQVTLHTLPLHFRKGRAVSFGRVHRRDGVDIDSVRFEIVPVNGNFVVTVTDADKRPKVGQHTRGTFDSLATLHRSCFG